MGRPKLPPRFCSNCGDLLGKNSAKGYCGKCYKRSRKHGDPNAVRSRWDGYEHPACSECGEPALAQRLCAKHYQRWHTWGDPTVSMQQVRGVCAFPGCGLPHDSHGYCTSHARQLRQGRELGELFPRGTWTREVTERVAGSVIRQAARLSKPRKYTLDETYFDEITDEQRAYWLGFITADGCVLEDPAGRPAYLRVDLSDCDEDHLRTLCTHLGSDRPVLYSEGCACVSFGSHRLADALCKLGVTPRKSLIVEPWDGPADLMPHYWRGLFDGDGTIFTSKGSWCVGICGSYACVAAFGSWARGITGGRSQPRSVRKDTECWQWTSQGSEKSQLLAAALYSDATVALARKSLLVQELCAIDFAARRTQRNAQRAAAMQDAWSTGRHPRAVKT